MNLFAINIYYYSELSKNWGGWKLGQAFPSDNILKSWDDEAKPYAILGGEGGRKKGFYIAKT